jgi:predicted phosphate transport protein (TIGR00153 family)
MSNTLGKLFGRSPIAPIQQHMQIAQETVQLLCGLLAASADQDWTRVAEIRRVIDSTAVDARNLRREIRRHLPRGLLLAMPRPDLLELLDVQDRIATCSSDIARPIALRSMHFPADLQAILDKLCGLLATTVSEALTAIRELDELVTSGFGKHERKVVEKLLTSLERNVQRCDLQQQRLLVNLSKTEESLPVLDVVFYYQIAATLGELGDACGEVGEQLDLLLAR